MLGSMSEFGGLWKHQNNPTGTKSVRVFIMLKLDTIGKKKEKKKHDEWKVAKSWGRMYK